MLCLCLSGLGMSPWLQTDDSKLWINSSMHNYSVVKEWYWIEWTDCVAVWTQPGRHRVMYLYCNVQCCIISYRVLYHLCQIRYHKTYSDCLMRLVVSWVINTITESEDYEHTYSNDKSVVVLRLFQCSAPELQSNCQTTSPLGVTGVSRSRRHLVTQTLQQCFQDTGQD